MNTIHNKQLKYEKALEYEIFIKGEYDFAKKEIQNAKCIFDIGGHKGLFSKRCRTLNPKAVIHYFEPVEEFYNHAQLILGNDKGIILNNYGISSKTEKGIILLNQEKTMQSSKYSSFLNPKGTKIKANFIKLKDYLQGNHISKIDVLKMDIEGMEFEVLSSRTDFERKRFDNLIAEIHILNKEMETKRNKIFIKIKDTFGDIKIIKSEYCTNTFLLRTKK